MPINILPVIASETGAAYYHDVIVSAKEADQYYEILRKNIDWQHDEVMMFGKRITTKRQVAWYADKGLSYTYAGVTKNSLPFNDTLLQLKTLVETKSDQQFNACLLNLYQNGTEGMGWHADNEKELLSAGAIASLSLGAERKFRFKHKATKQTAEVMLKHGSLLVMQGDIQQQWLHQLPVMKKVTRPRINLTFRTILAR